MRLPHFVLSGGKNKSAPYAQPRRNTMRKIKTMVLDYYPEFKCLMDKCNYTCCQSWNIDIRRNDYMKLRNLHTDKQTKEMIQNSFKRTKDDTGKHYAQIKLKEDGYCAFLTDDKMCGLQQKCGYAVLPEVCKTFPRGKRYMGFQKIMCCSIGCEQTVNLLLDRPEGVRLVEYNEGKTQCIQNEQELLKFFRKNPKTKYNREIEMLFMGILQNRKYSLYHRMILFGMAAKNLDAAQTESEILAFIQKSLPLLKYDAAMEEQLKNLNTDFVKGLETSLRMIWDYIGAKEYLKNKNNAKERSVFDSVRKNLSMKLEYSETDNHFKLKFSPHKYLQAKKHFEELEYTNYLMENVMVNILIQKACGVLLNGESTMWTNYLKLCGYYLFLKLFCVPYMADKTEKQDLVTVITVCGRMAVHNDEFIESFVLFTQLMKQKDLSHIAQFLDC